MQLVQMLNLWPTISFAERNLDGSLDYERDFFSSGHVYSLNDAREIAKLCNGAVVNKHTKEIIEDYRECVDKQSRWWYYKYIKRKGVIISMRV